jgi:two-component system OmpR family sensor kinase
MLPFDTPDGEGAQIGVLTGWAGGPCAVWLGRMRPEPTRASSQRWLFVDSALLFFGAVVLGGWMLSERVRRAGRVAREVAGSGYNAVVPASGRDEFTAIVTSFNEAGADVRRRGEDVKDREEAHRRFLGRVGDELVPPLDALESQLTDPAAVKTAHDIAAHAANLLAGARLRMRAGLTANDDVDLRGVVTRVAQRYAGLARASQVTIDTSLPADPIVLVGEAALFDRALGNLVENAIENNRPGGHVNVRLAAAEAGKFSLRVIDDGRGMSDEQLTKLMAVRRFRGDEGKGGPGKRGLGLALVWEVAERSNLQVAIRQASGGGVAVEISGKAT